MYGVWIFTRFFAFKSDESGKLILGALHDAADRGVHIRLLVDGMESWIDISDIRSAALKLRSLQIFYLPVFYCYENNHCLHDPI